MWCFQQKLVYLQVQVGRVPFLHIPRPRGFNDKLYKLWYSNTFSLKMKHEWQCKAIKTVIHQPWQFYELKNILTIYGSDYLCIIKTITTLPDCDNFIDYLKSNYIKKKSYLRLFLLRQYFKVIGFIVLICVNIGLYPCVRKVPICYRSLSSCNICNAKTKLFRNRRPYTNN